MRVVEAATKVEIQTCHLSDEAVWGNLSDSDQLSIARMFQDDIDELSEESYNRGYEDGREAGYGEDDASYFMDQEREEIRNETLREVQRRLITFAEGLHL